MSHTGPRRKKLLEWRLSGLIDLGPSGSSLEPRFFFRYPKAPCHQGAPLHVHIRKKSKSEIDLNAGHAIAKPSEREIGIDNRSKPDELTDKIKKREAAVTENERKAFRNVTYDADFRG